MASLGKLARLGLVNDNEEYKVANEYRTSMNIKAPTVLAKTGKLSGGNQQKVVLSKWIYSDPDVLILDDFGMRKLPHTAAEDLLEIVMRRYERASTLLTSNRPVEDWGKLLGDVAAVSAMLDRLLHHGHVLKCGPRSWRTKTAPAS